MHQLRFSVSKKTRSLQGQRLPDLHPHQIKNVAKTGGPNLGLGFANCLSIGLVEGLDTLGALKRNAPNSSQCKVPDLKRPIAEVVVSLEWYMSTLIPGFQVRDGLFVCDKWTFQQCRYKDNGHELPKR